MIQPIKVHGMLIYNLLKRQLICPEEEKDDEMWFGLGEKKARFGREEFCLCSGLNMGTLPEGFQEKEEVSEESILTHYFVDENPSIELLEATFNRLTEPSEGDDALKMGYLLMVSQFFGMDEARTAIPSWVLSLVEDIDAFESFPWGSYIFDVSPNLSPLHNFNDGEKFEKDLNKEDVEEVERAKVEKAEVEMAEVEKAEVEMAEVEKADDKDDTGIVVAQPLHGRISQHDTHMQHDSNDKSRHLASYNVVSDCWPSGMHKAHVLNWGILLSCHQRYPCVDLKLSEQVRDARSRREVASRTMSMTLSTRNWQTQMPKGISSHYHPCIPQLTKLPWSWTSSG
ncbi:hypothetical protein LWI29_028689 [Acer saccharum]|uniref:DUF1985 domain-containing protein n=1 Tax=Acer saccharum TaxID=4024 RepID=A0AA39S4T4_ACESA|nr:hypothetical protein LWI29_028689 [Acer saccharum]